MSITQKVVLKNKSDPAAHGAGVHCKSVSQPPHRSTTRQLLRHPLYRSGNWSRKGRCVLVKIAGKTATREAAAEIPTGARA